MVLSQPSGLFWLPWEPLQHLANCETALPLYWGCHSEHAEFNGTVERFEFREWPVPETGSELEKSPSTRAGRLDWSLLMGEDEAALKPAELCPSPQCGGPGVLRWEGGSLANARFHSPLCISIQGAQGSVLA